MVHLGSISEGQMSFDGDVIRGMGQLFRSLELSVILWQTHLRAAVKKENGSCIRTSKLLFPGYLGALQLSCD